MADKPLHALLGTKKTKILRYGDVRGTQPDFSPHKYAGSVASYLQRTGLRATKLHFPGAMGTEDSISFKDVMTTLTAVREAVGDDKILAWDPYPRSAESATHSVDEAKQMIRLTDQLGFAWFEGPLPPVPYETQIPKYVELMKMRPKLRLQAEGPRSPIGDGTNFADMVRWVEAGAVSQKRQAAPFRRRKRVEQRKKRGRKKGHAAAKREPPKKVTRVVDVPVKTCPDCQVPLTDKRVDVQYQTDLPPIEPITTQFNVESGSCPCCGQRVQGRHPDQTSDALGAAANQLGPRVLSFAIDLKYRLGVPFRKVSDFFRTLAGIQIAPSTITRAAERLATKGEATYEALQEDLRTQGLVVHGDETGWRIDISDAWLWVLVFGWAIAQMVTLVAPNIVVIGGGVSLVADELLLIPLRNHVRRYVFPPWTAPSTSSGQSSAKRSPSTGPWLWPRSNSQVGYALAYRTVSENPVSHTPACSSITYVT